MTLAEGGSDVLNGRPWSLRTLLGAIAYDVFRRCRYEGCWKRGKYPSLILGRTCYEHWPYRLEVEGSD